MVYDFYYMVINFLSRKTYQDYLTYFSIYGVIENMKIFLSLIYIYIYIYTYIHIHTYINTYSDL